jgi:hypothetical protein
MCTIVNGPPPEEIRFSAYIEWHWIARYTDLDTLRPISVTGKFIFVASADYIKRQVQKYGYPGISGSGIGMFNPSNHNS